MIASGCIKLRVELLDIAPPIWRRIAVPGGLHLDELHLIIQEAFGWTDSHLHDFRTRTRRYSGMAAERPDDLFGPDGDSIDIPEDSVTVAQVLNRKGARMVYTYDFGDNWQHLITHQGPCAPGEMTGLVGVLAGARACPPEDCGGIPGYENLIAVMKNASHPERPDLLEWLGGEEFDPEAFDLKAADARVRRLVRPPPKPARGRGRTPRSRRRR